MQNDYLDSKPADSLDANFSQNVETFRSVYDNCSDVMFRSFLLFGKTRAMIIYIAGLSDIEGIEQYVLSSLMQESSNEPQPLNEFLENKMPVPKVVKVNILADCLESISSGNPILLYEGGSDGFSLGLSKWEKRAIEEPVAESGIRGHERDLLNR